MIARPALAYSTHFRIAWAAYKAHWRVFVMSMLITLGAWVILELAVLAFQSLGVRIYRGRMPSAQAGLVARTYSSHGGTSPRSISANPASVTSDSTRGTACLIDASPVGPSSRFQPWPVGA
jgi:hypothetical protein